LEWVNLLEQFGEGNDFVLESLSKGAFLINAGTASRFYIRVENTYKKRKQIWLDKFQRSFQLQSLRSISDLEIVLRNGKQNLRPLIGFVTLNGLPEDLRKTLSADLEDFVLEIKTSLKDKVSKMSKERERMILILNSFGLDDMAEKTTKPEVVMVGELPPKNRKIIFQNGK